MGCCCSFVIAVGAQKAVIMKFATYSEPQGRKNRAIVKKATTMKPNSGEISAIKSRKMKELKECVLLFCLLILAKLAFYFLFLEEAAIVHVI